MTIYDISGNIKATIEIGEGSIRKYELMKEDYVQLKFSLSTPLVFNIGDYVDFFREGYPYLTGLGRFVVTEEYRPDFSSNTMSYNYTLTLEAEYRAWQNKIFKYIPDHGGQECSWTLTAKPSVFLDVLLANLTYYHEISSEDDDSFVFHYYHDGEVKTKEYRYAINDQVLGDGTVIEFNKKAITVSFSNTSILDALNAIAEQCGGEWWVKDDCIWIGRCENFRKEYGEGNKTDSHGNYIHYKDEEGNEITYGGRDYVPNPLERDITIDFLNGTPPNVESYTISKGSSKYANRIFMFGSERNIPSYYRKKLIFTKDSNHPNGDGQSGFYDSTRMMTPLDFHSETYEYDADSSAEIWTGNSSHSLTRTITYKKGEKKELTIKYSDIVDGKDYADWAADDDTEVTFRLSKGLTAIESADFKAMVSGANIETAQIIVAVMGYENGNEAERATTLVKMEKSGAVFTAVGIPYTEFKIIDDTRIYSDNLHLEYRFEFVASDDFNTENTATIKVLRHDSAHPSTIYNNFNLTLHNRNPKVVTRGFLDLDTRTEAKFVMNPAFRPYYSIYAKSFRAYTRKTISETTWESFSRDYWPDNGTQYELERIIRGKVKGSYYTKDIQSEVAVNGIVQKRLMLPVDTTNEAFNVSTGTNKGIKQFAKYDDYFTDNTKTVGKARIDKDPDAPVNQIVEMVVIDDSIYPNIEDTAYDVSLTTDTEKDDDGNETTTYYYKFTGESVFAQFTKDFILDCQTLQIVFGANARDESDIPVEDRGGLLNGMTFDAELKREKVNGVLKTYFRVVPNETYGVSLPNEILKPVEGDKFALVNYDPAYVGEATIYEAENRLVKAGYAYMEDLHKDKSTYTYKMMSDSSKAMMDDPNGDFFHVGDVVYMFGQSLFDSSGRESRVISVEQKLDIPYDTPTVGCGESSAYSRLTALEGKVDGLQYKGTEYSSVGGEGGGSSVEIIKTDETTQPSDYNVFSSSRTRREIEKSAENFNGRINDKLSRVDDDTAEGNITFNKDIEVVGKSDFGGLSTFDGNYNIPFNNVGRIKGSLLFQSWDDDSSDDSSNDDDVSHVISPTKNGSINGNGNAVFRTLKVVGHDTNGQITDFPVSELSGTTIFEDLLGKKNVGEETDFVDGFTGHGFRTWKENNLWHVTTDFLTVRQQMKVFELLIQKIRSTGGSIVVSAANGKIKNVSEASISTQDDTWLLTFEQDTDFAAGDIVRVQSFKGLGTQAGSYENRVWWGIVAGVTTLNNEKVIAINKSIWNTGSFSSPQDGDDVVQWGNTGVTSGRDKLMYLTAAENDKMGICMYEDVNTIGSNGKLTLKIGDLSDVVDQTFGGQLSGWGLYAQSVYLKGDMELPGGGTVTQKFEVANGKLESTISGVRATTKGDSIISNHKFTEQTQGWADDWTAVGTSAQELSDGDDLLSDGTQLLAGYGDSTKYVRLCEDDMVYFMRIIDSTTSQEPTVGFKQNVKDFRPLYQGLTKVQLRFSYRMTADSDFWIYLSGNTHTSGTGEKVGVLDTDHTVSPSIDGDSILYDFETKVVKDEKWHSASLYGQLSFPSSGEIYGTLFVLGYGQVDITDLELLEVDGIEKLGTAIKQNEESISLVATAVGDSNSGLTKRVGQLEVRAGTIEATVSLIDFDENDNINNINTSGLVTVAGSGSNSFSSMFTADLLETDDFYTKTWNEQTHQYDYTLKLTTLQAATNAAKNEILGSENPNLSTALQNSSDVAHPSDITTLATKIDNNASDGRISAGSEKSELKVDWHKVVSEYAKYSTNPFPSGSDAYTAVSSFITAYNTATRTLAIMLNGGGTSNIEGVLRGDVEPAWIDSTWFGSDTVLSTYSVTPTTYRNNWTSYYTALTNLVDAIKSAQISETSDIQDSLSDFVTTENMTAQFSGVYEHDSNGNLVYWTTAMSDYKASDWGNPPAYRSSSYAYYRQTIDNVEYLFDYATQQKVPKFKVNSIVSTYNFVEYDDSSGEKLIKGGVKIEADKIDINSNHKLALNAGTFSITSDNFLLTEKGDVTVSGVLNNNIMTVGKDENLSSGIRACRDVFSCDTYSATIPEHIWLDPLKLGRMVKLRSDFNSKHIHLPMALKNGDDTLVVGKVGYGNEQDDITLDELRKSVGKVFTFFNASPSSSQQQSDHVYFECGESSDGWLMTETISYTSGSTTVWKVGDLNSNSSYTQTKYLQRGYRTSILPGFWLELEFCMDRYSDYELFYWKVRNNAKMLPEPEND